MPLAKYYYALGMKPRNLPNLATTKPNDSLVNREQIQHPQDLPTTTPQVRRNSEQLPNPLSLAEFALAMEIDDKNFIP